MSYSYLQYLNCCLAFVYPHNGVVFHHSIVGSVVECSPATRAARVRFPDDAKKFFYFLIIFTYMYNIFAKIIGNFIIWKADFLRYIYFQVEQSPPFLIFSWDWWESEKISWKLLIITSTNYLLKNNIAKYLLVLAFIPLYLHYS